MLNKGRSQPFQNLIFLHIFVAFLKKHTSPNTNELAPLTLYRYKKRSLGRHRGALVALQMHWELSGTIFNDNQPRDLA